MPTLEGTLANLFGDTQDLPFELGVPVVAYGDQGQLRSIGGHGFTLPTDATGPESAAAFAVAQLSGQWGLGAECTLEQDQLVSLDNGHHRVTLAQYHLGFRILDADVRVWTDAGFGVRRLVSTIIHELGANDDSIPNPDQAIELLDALSAAGLSGPATYQDAELAFRVVPSTETAAGRLVQLVWRIRATSPQTGQPATFLVDASDGTLLSASQGLLYGVKRFYNHGAGYSPTGDPPTLAECHELGAYKGACNTAASCSAMPPPLDDAGLAAVGWESYFQSNWGWDSVDDLGTPIYLINNYVPSPGPPFGLPAACAFVSYKVDSSGDLCPFVGTAGPEDGDAEVIQHELTQAFAWAAAGMDDTGPAENRCVSEHLGDAMAAVLEPSTDWTWPAGPNSTCGNRDLATPTLSTMLGDGGISVSMGQTDHWDWLMWDPPNLLPGGGLAAAWEHVNNGFLNKFSHLFAAGGAHYGTAVSGQGTPALGDSLFRTVRNYLSVNHNFNGYARAFAAAAMDEDLAALDLSFPRFKAAQAAADAVGLWRPHLFTTSRTFSLFAGGVALNQAAIPNGYVFWRGRDSTWGTPTALHWRRLNPNNTWSADVEEDNVQMMDFGIEGPAVAGPTSTARNLLRIYTTDPYGTLHHDVFDATTDTLVDHHEYCELSSNHGPAATMLDDEFYLVYVDASTNHLTVVPPGVLGCSSGTPPEDEDVTDGLGSGASEFPIVTVNDEVEVMGQPFALALQGRVYVFFLEVGHTRLRYVSSTAPDIPSAIWDGPLDVPTAGFDLGTTTTRPVGGGLRNDKIYLNFLVESGTIVLPAGEPGQTEATLSGRALVSLRLLDADGDGLFETAGRSVPGNPMPTGVHAEGFAPGPVFTMPLNKADTNVWTFSARELGPGAGGNFTWMTRQSR